MRGLILSETHNFLNKKNLRKTFRRFFLLLKSHHSVVMMMILS